MKRTKKIRITKNYLLGVGAAISILVLTVIGVHLLHTTHAAAGDAYFSLSPSSGSYTVGDNLVLSVTETSTSSDNTNAAQADLSYPSELQYQSISLNGPFTLCGQEKAGSGLVEIGCASTTVVSGTQPIAQITFSVLTSGTDQIKMISGSDIDNTSGISVWNTSLASASFTFSQPVATPTTPAPTTPAPGTSLPSNTKSSGKSPSSNSTKSTTPTSTPTTTTTTPTSTPITTPAAPSLASISVTVINTQGKSIAGAKVTLDKQQSILTNANGVANFSAVTSGTYIITVSEPGTKSIQTQFSLTPGENKLMNLKLTNISSGRSYTVLIFLGVILVILLVVGNICFRVFRRKLKATPPTAVISDDNIIPNLSGNANTAPAPTVIAPSQPEIPTTITQDSSTYKDQNIAAESLITGSKPPEIIPPQHQNTPATTNDQNETIIHPAEPHTPE
jgi:hypothetical protein